MGDTGWPTASDQRHLGATGAQVAPGLKTDPVEPQSQHRDGNRTYCPQIVPYPRQPMDEVRNSADERSEIEVAEQVLVEQCPNPQDRRLLLERFLASVDAANGFAPNAWCATLFSNGFRLNVGQVEALVFLDGQLRANLVGLAATAPYIGANFQQASYRSLPQPLCAFVGSLRQYASVAAGIAEAHTAFVQLAAHSASGRPRRGSPYSRSHSEGLIQYARAEVGRHRAT